MSDELHVKVVGSSSLVPVARDALRDCLEQHGKDVFQEAGRLEANNHSTAGPPLITDSNIADAHGNMRRGYIRRRQSKKGVALTVLSYLAAVAAGVAGNFITKPAGSVGFALSVIAGVVLLILGRD